MLIAIAALVSSTEVDDIDQKKRGVAKGTSLNTIPTGAQKQDYTYSIYAQNPSPQSSSNPSYVQASNSFYPSQSNQYYTSNTPADPSVYHPQPQINLVPQSSSSPFVPINFVPNPGYQSKYQIIPSKPGGNIQFALIPQPSNNAQQFNAQSFAPYSQIPQSLFAPTPGNPISPNQNPFSSFSPQGQFNVAPNLPFSLGNNYLGQPSTMLLLAQPNPSPYNNIFQNPAQSVYNFPSSYPTNSQNRYGVPYSGASDVQIQSSLTKEENDLSAQTSEYTAPSESSTNYKTAYASSRSSYSKL